MRALSRSRRCVHVLLVLAAVSLGFPSGAQAKRGIAVRPRAPSGAEVKGEQWLFVIGVDSYIQGRAVQKERSPMIRVLLGKARLMF